jgi:UPF0716 family protein affecting phage T7 exclusion
MYISLHVKYPLFLSDFNEIWILLPILRKIFKQDLTKIVQVGAELFHADRRAGERT